ncbi:hypothetical protein ACFOHL_06320 [Agaribacter flavus]|uniref:Phytase-like domain-containing protein n=2 Tax=Agaribacter flavus TaxID=1902781 RepID=A0ABV7FLP9_9ALTE
MSLLGCSSLPQVNTLQGKWILEKDGSTMLNPQTSGLVMKDGVLYSVSDASADESQIKRLHMIDPNSARVINKSEGMAFDEFVKNSCFYSYLAGEPDYEALVPDPYLDDAWIWVTEDASRGEPLSGECQRQYGDSNSTTYPTLLVRLVQEGDALRVIGVRPLQFDTHDGLADLPNDGIEGLALTKDKKLLLGLEKDGAGQPRVFSVTLSSDFFDSLLFARVKDAGLKLPTFDSGSHPINGMDVFYRSNGDGYLVAAARNDNELWIIDLQKQKETVIVPLEFFAPSNTSQNCAAFHLMDNASLEGVAIADGTIYLVNDPWKENYHKNLVCPQDKTAYDRFSPLLFQLAIDDAWFN